MGKQFTEKSIAAAKPKNVKYYLREGRGFTLQVMPTAPNPSSTYSSWTGAGAISG